MKTAALVFSLSLILAACSGSIGATQGSGVGFVPTTSSPVTTPVTVTAPRTTVGGLPGLVQPQ